MSLHIHKLHTIRINEHRFRPFVSDKQAPARMHAARGNLFAVYEGSESSAALEDDTTPVLYTHVLCPYAQRAWLALLEKDLEFRLVNIDLSSKPSWYMRLNPAGLVPSVAHRGHVQTESLDICRWVDETFDGRPLVIPGMEAETQNLIKDCSKFSSAGLSYIAGTTGRSWGIGEGQTRAQKQDFLKQLNLLAKHIRSSGGPFLTGDTPSLADIVYYPFLERFSLIMQEFFEFDLKAVDDGLIGSWLNALERRKAFQTSSAEPNLFLKAFKQHRSLDFFDFHTYKATALHPHLQQESLRS